MSTKPLFFCGLLFSVFFSSCQEQEDLKTAATLKFNKGILCFFQDSKGNFWFGSEQEGACRYDGTRYTYFTMADGLPQNQIRIVEEDDKGNIWFNGRSYYDGNVITTLKEQVRWNPKMTVSPGTLLSYLGRMPGEEVSLSAPSEAVLCYDWDRNYLAFPIPNHDSIDYQRNPFLPSYVLTYLKDRDGKIWLGTESRGVIAYDGKNMTCINPDNFGKTAIYSIFQDRSGRYWFGSDGNGLYHYDGKSPVNFSAKHPSAELDHVWAINQDDQGDLWFGTRDAGVWRYSGKKWRHYTTQDGLPDNSAKTIYKDRDGTMWLATRDGDVCTFNGKTFDLFYKNQTD